MIGIMAPLRYRCLIFGVYLGFVLFGPIKTHSLAPIKPLKDKPLKDRNNGWAVAES